MPLSLATPEYWRERMIARNDLMFDDYNLYSRKLSKLYKGTINANRAEIYKFYAEYALEEGITIEAAQRILNKTELKNFHKKLASWKLEFSQTNDPYIMRKIDTYTRKIRIQRLEALNLTMETELSRLYQTQEDMLTDHLTLTYQNNYYRSIYDIQRATVVSSFAKVNRRLVETTLRYPWSGDNFSSRIWKNKEQLTNVLNTTLLQGVVQGKGPKEIAKEISDKTGTAFYNAERLARTETTYIISESTKKSYEETGANKYEYVITLDDRTSAVCQELDGMVFRVSEARAGINFPPMHPNCRSDTIPYFSEAQLSRMARNIETGESEIIPEKTTYEQFAKDNNIQIFSKKVA